MIGYLRVILTLYLVFNHLQLLRNQMKFLWISAFPAAFIVWMLKLIFLKINFLVVDFNIGNRINGLDAI